MLSLRSFAALISAGMIASGLAAAASDDYPSRPIRMMAPTAGGGTDFAARIVAQGLSAGLGQQVIVENRSAAVHGTWLPGAPPDGYNILMGGESTWMVPLLKPMPYDILRDFVPITLVGNSPNVLVVHPSLPVKSTKELIDLAKSKPGDINYSSSSSGGSAHLAAELFASLAGVKIVRISHKGAGEALVSLLTGQGVHLAFISIASVVPHVKAGRLRGLAVTSVKPSNALPGLPTVAETVPGYQSGGQTALFAPPKTPPAFIAKLNREAVRYLVTPDVKEKFFNSGVDVIASSPQELSAFIKSEIVRWGKVIKDAGIKLDS